MFSNNLPPMRQTTWAGCGQHVDQVMKNIPSSQRCTGHDDEPRTGFFARIFGRCPPNRAGAPRASAEGAGLAEFWEEQYSGQEWVWSRRVNPALVDTVAGFSPGRALDMGCGEGSDVIWLATHGWDATGIDLSPTAITRAGRLPATTG